MNVCRDFMALSPVLIKNEQQSYRNQTWLNVMSLGILLSQYVELDFDCLHENANSVCFSVEFDQLNRYFCTN